MGASPALAEIREKIDLVAPIDATVLVVGETGTGKEVVAGEIHQRSRRKHRRLVTVNCGSVPRELFESEFFGHVKGSFTGAHRDRVGLFALADNGTLFLDEVGEIPADVQVKLLRVLQEGLVHPIGGESSRKVDVRVIAATNRDLGVEVAEGRFRSDLFFRLNVFPIAVPPLRDRLEDIDLLADHLLERAAIRHGVPKPVLGLEQRQRLRAHHWPGNVRELANVMERAVITARRGALELDLPAPGRLDGSGVCPVCGAANRAPSRVLTEAEVRTMERTNILTALHASGGRIYGPDGAAALLEVPPTTLRSRIRKMGLSTGEWPYGVGELKHHEVS